MSGYTHEPNFVMICQVAAEEFTTQTETQTNRYKHSHFNSVVICTFGRKMCRLNKVFDRDSYLDWYAYNHHQ